MFAGSCVAEGSSVYKDFHDAKARSKFSQWDIIINTDAITLNARAAFFVIKYKQIVTRLIPVSHVILIISSLLESNLTCQHGL